MTDRERDGVAFVRRDHVGGWRHVVGDVRAEILEERVRDSGEEPEALFPELLVDGGTAWHQRVPGIRSRTSEIGMSSSSISAERPCSRIDLAALTIAG